MGIGVGIDKVGDNLELGEKDVVNDGCLVDVVDEV